MKYLPFKLLFLLMAFLFVASVVGQTDELPPLDESQFNDQAPVPSPAPAAEPNNRSAPAVDAAKPSSPTSSSATEKPSPLPDLGPEPDLGAEPDLSGSTTDDGSIIKTAVIEGVQVSSEPGEKPDEKVVTCYFIFQDKPSSYFYEVKLKEKKIVFEFNDTKKSDAPINFSAEQPMKDFTVEQKQININKEIKGLKAEFHNQVRVTFNVTAVPKIQVSDEFNVISFTYKWTSDPAKQKEFIVVDPGPKVIIWSGASVATIGAGALVYFLFFGPKPPPPPGPLEIGDLPKHPNPN